MLYTSSGNVGDHVDGLYVRAGRPDGTLADAVKVDTGTPDNCPLTSLAVGDVNGDGRADVVVAGESCGVRVLLQASDGTLAQGSLFGTSGIQLLKIADLDRNGRQVLIGIGGSPAAVTLWRQDGGGVLQLSQTLSSNGANGVDIDVGDINGDGRTDLAMAVGGAAGPGLALFMRNADGSFAAAQMLPVGGSQGAYSVAIGDINGDGRADIVATSFGTTSSQVVALYQAADGSFGAATPLTGYENAQYLSLADLNGDGLPDLVVSYFLTQTVGVRLQQSGGGFAAEQIFPSAPGNYWRAQLAIGDIDHDGRPDILVCGSALLQLPPLSASSSQLGRRAAAAARPAIRRALDAGPRNR